MARSVWRAPQTLTSYALRYAPLTCRQARLRRAVEIFVAAQNTATHTATAYDRSAKRGACAERRAPVKKQYCFPRRTVLLCHMELTPRARALLFNLFGRGKIHVGALPVPIAIILGALHAAKKKARKKMSLRYCPWPAFTDTTPLVFNGTGTDFKTITTPVFPAGAPVPEALIHIVLCGAVDTQPENVHVRIIDADDVVVCTLRDFSSPSSLPLYRIIFEVATGIAGRAGLKLQIAASSACTLSPCDIGSSGLVIWAE